MMISILILIISNFKNEKEDTSIKIDAEMPSFSFISLNVPSSYPQSATISYFSGIILNTTVLL